MNYADYTDALLKYIEIGGPLAGILMTSIEAFVPLLPLVAFVIINVQVFGFLGGYIYSCIGNCLGSYLLFLLIRRIGGKKFEKKIKASKYAGTLEKIKKKNLSILFFLYCFPFTPSYLITGAAALTNMFTKQFLTLLIPSKFIMIMSLAFIGKNVSSFFDNPVKSIIFILIILLINTLGKKAVEKYEENHRLR